MRRRSRGVVTNLTVFSFILFLIIYLNHEKSSTKTFRWKTIRYQPLSSTLPERQGVCPGLADSSKPALVVARIAADDSEWLDELRKSYHLCIYTADLLVDTSSRTLQVPANRGHEAMAYLTFLIDNYDIIPTPGAVFVHGSRWAWHNDSPDYDNAKLLAALNVTSALAPWGYHNLRCDWSASTCLSSEAPPQGSLETATRAMLEPYNMRAASDRALPGALAAIFGAERSLGRSDALRSQCCAQFVVSRERVWQHSRDEYVALRQWLLDGSDGRSNKAHLQKQSGKAAPHSDLMAGRILSYVWHILFLSHLGTEGDTVNLEQLNRLACPRADECYCRLYGRCRLDGLRYDLLETALESETCISDREPASGASAQSARKWRIKPTTALHLQGALRTTGKMVILQFNQDSTSFMLLDLAFLDWLFLTRAVETSE
ncbi:MAG: hypothetical protein Q9227_008839 [Pyrenula ochraceoflavens]